MSKSVNFGKTPDTGGEIGLAANWEIYSEARLWALLSATTDKGVEGRYRYFGQDFLGLRHGCDIRKDCWQAQAFYRLE